MPEIEPKAIVRRIDVGDAVLACRVVGDGPLVLLAHGFPDCWRSFREQEPALLAAGYTVASVSMRGYAPSSPSKRGRYDALTLGADLLAVGRRLSPERPFMLVGHDWGAVASYAAVAQEPSRIRALVTAAVPHLGASALGFFKSEQMRRSWYMWFFQLRFLADRRLLANDMALVERLWRDWSPGYRCPADAMQELKAAIAAHPGAVLGYYRAILSRATLTPSRLGRIFQPITIPSLYLHGRDDGCVGPELIEGVSEKYRGPFDCHVLDDCGHFLHLEKATEVNRLLVDFLGQYAC